MCDTPKLNTKKLRKGRSFRTIAPDHLARAMAFSVPTVQKYVRTGLLHSVEYEGKVWVIQPGQRWTVLQILGEAHRREEGKPAKPLRSVPYLTSKSVGEILNVCQRRVQKLAAEGILPSIRINPHGGPYRFAVTDIVRHMGRRIRGVTPAKVGQARAQLQVIRRLARQRLR